MAGQKQILNKNIYFVVGRGVRTGYFFYPGFSSPCVRVLLSAFTHSIYYYASQLITDSHETPVIPELAINLELYQFVSSCPQHSGTRKYFQDKLVSQKYIAITLIQSYQHTYVMQFHNFIVVQLYLSYLIILFISLLLKNCRMLFNN